MAEPTAAQDSTDFATLLSESAREHGGALSPEETEVEEVVDPDVDGTKGEEETEPTNEEESEEDNKPRWAPFSGKRPGTDVIKEYLREHYPEALEVVRGMEATVSKNINETKQLQQQLIDALEEIRDIRSKPAEKETPEPHQDRLYNEDQMALVRQILEDVGVLTKEEMAQREAETESSSYVKAALKQGVEEYGEAFGSIDEEGNVVLTDEVKEAIQPILDRIENKGVTPLDLAKIAGLSLPKKEAKTEAPRPAKKTASSLRKANVVSRTAGIPGKTKVKLYDRARGDSGDEVFDRAWLLANQELTGSRR